MTESEIKRFQYNLSNDYEGLKKKIDIIAGVMKKGSENMRIRTLALSARKGAQDFNYREELELIYDYVCKNISYVRDTYKIEVIHDAEKVLDFEAGDCDDFVILLGALLLSIGWTVRIVICGREKNSFSHIYLQCWEPVERKWITADASMKYPLSKESTAQYKKYFMVK